MTRDDCGAGADAGTRESKLKLTGRRFVLVPFTEKDISPAYINWLNDPDVNRFLEIRFVPQSHETAKAFVTSFYEANEKYMWGIYPKGAEEPIGTATLYGINCRHGSAEVGLMIGEKAHWGSGASVEALDLICEYAFRRLGLRKVTGGTYAVNLGMNFTYKRLGFALEGKLRQAWVLSDGSIVDGYRWGLLAEEWEARHKNGD